MRQEGKFFRKWTAGLLAVILLAMQFGAENVNAAESVTVSAKNAVLYSNDKTTVYANPDFNATIITVISANLPVQVTGITSNGWFQVSLEGTFYIPGYGLQEKTTGTAFSVTYSDEDIKKMVSGTFSFYKNAELRAFTREEVEDMDANTYIKYLDSFLIGNAMVDYCILQDSGVTLKTEYDKKAAEDKKVAAMSMKDYLVTYRNDYLKDSLWGPVRNEKELKVTLNRAVRYEVNTFSTVFKSAVIGDEQIKMEKVLSNLKEEMKAEQGVTFSYKMSYGSYQTDEGHSASGWIIEFTRA